MPITVGVLGAFSVSGQGDTVDLPGRRQRSLTAILALEGGRIVSAARLIDLLWPDTEPADPLNALQHQVSRLRAAIGRDAVVRDEAGYGLDVTPDRVDALRFEQLATLGRDQLANGATADLDAAEETLGDLNVRATDVPAAGSHARRLLERGLCCVESEIVFAEAKLEAAWAEESHDVRRFARATHRAMSAQRSALSAEIARDPHERTPRW